MVSTRLMSTVGNSSGDSYGQTQVPGPSKLSRNNVHQTTIVPFISSDINIADKLTSTVQINLLNLPTEIIEKILSFVNFKTVCNTRLVCRTMDIISGQILNSTFLKLQTQMLNRFHAIKSKMPRRESARRNHHLACESDIIETLHMRLTLLQMSFGKHIERKHCCFFPGEILDEVYNILNYIKITPKLARPYKVTDELFDLSTMAMEYFKEKIEPDLPEIAYFGTDFLDFTGRFSSTNNGKYLALDSSPLSSEEVKEIDNPSCSSLDSSTLVEPLPQSNMVLRKRIRKIKQGLKRYNSQLSLLRQDLRTCKRKTSEQQKQISEQQKQLAEQQKQTLEYAARLDEYDKKNEEISRKFSTMLQELNKCKTELQYWRSKSPATTPSCFGCGNIIRPSIEDLQPLINQGIVLDGLGLNPSEECNFMPIASTSSENHACITNAEVELINKDHAVEDMGAMNSESNNLINEKKGTKRKLNETPATSNCTTKRQLQKGRSKRIKV